MTNKELLTTLEDMEKFLRGIVIDPEIPEHVTEELWAKLGQLTITLNAIYDEREES